MRRQWLYPLAFGAVLFGCVALGAYWAIRQVPDFYAEALSETPEPDAREREARRFVQRTLKLVDDFRHADRFSEEFTHQQVNSWLCEDLPRQFARVIPAGVSEPRVRFSDNEVHLGFRYEKDGLHSVVSLKLSAWVPKDNQLAIKIQRVRAGLLPIPLEKVLQGLTSRFDSEGWRVDWRQHEGADVLVFHLHPPEDSGPKLKAVEIGEGVVRIWGDRRQSDSSRIAGLVSWLRPL